MVTNTHTACLCWSLYVRLFKHRYTQFDCTATPKVWGPYGLHDDIIIRWRWHHRQTMMSSDNDVIRHSCGSACKPGELVASMCGCVHGVDVWMCMCVVYLRWMRGHTVLIVSISNKTRHSITSS